VRLLSPERPIPDSIKDDAARLEAYQRFLNKEPEEIPTPVEIPGVPMKLPSTLSQSRREYIKKYVEELSV